MVWNRNALLKVHYFSDTHSKTDHTKIVILDLHTWPRYFFFLIENIKYENFVRNNFLGDSLVLTIKFQERNNSKTNDISEIHNIFIW